MWWSRAGAGAVVADVVVEFVAKVELPIPDWWALLVEVEPLVQTVSVNHHGDPWVGLRPSVEWLNEQLCRRLSW